MPLLAEYSVIPDVLDSTCYTSEELGDVHLQHLKEALLEDGIVRNLRDGEWLQHFADTPRTWHKRGTELLKKLRVQNRLRVTPSAMPASPSDDVAWCNEALQSHSTLPLAGVISTERTSSSFRSEQLVAPITRIRTAPWWQSRGSSVRSARSLAAYQDNLRLILDCANSVMFIDPHCDPGQYRYRGLSTIISSLQTRQTVPLVEIHRVCYFDTQDKRDQHDLAGWKRFFGPLSTPLRGTTLTAQVFIWDDFHDRFLISDLVGISMSNGFDTTTQARASTTWTRLSRSDRDDVQREFDPAARRHELRHRFVLPA